MTNLEDMKKDINELIVNKNAHSSPYCALALAGEVGELCNFVKKELRSNNSISHQSDIELEVPDILFYLLAFCEHRGISIEFAWDNKMRLNSSKYKMKVSRLEGDST